MPPALSDDENTDVSDLPEVHKKRGRKPTSKPESEVEPESNQEAVNDSSAVKPKAEDGDEEDEDEELEEDEFIVEKILQHVVEDGKLMFQVKWEGWDNPEDITYEPEENLQGAEAVLNAYYETVGGREKVMQEIREAEERIKEQKKRKRGRASAGADNKRVRKANGHPRDTTPPAGFSDKRNGKFVPPSGSWEDHIEAVDASQDENTGKLVVYLTWKNGQKTCHDTKTVYKRCPQQMLRFYENHIKIVTNGTDEYDDPKSL